MLGSSIVKLHDYETVMNQFQYGHSSGASAEALVEDCLSQIGPIPETANLGFIYATDSLAHNLDGIVTSLKRETGIPHWTGTVGLGVNALGREYYEAPALAIMIAAFPESAYRTIPLQRSDIGGLVDVTRGWLNQNENYFGLLHGDPTNPDTHRLISMLADHLPNSFFVGGLSSSHNWNPQVADNVCSGGISGVLFSSDVPLVTSHTQGCTPVAGMHTITECKQNIIITLDDRPALEVLVEDAGEVIARDLQRLGGYIFVGLHVPGSDTGDYLVRNLMGIDPDQQLIAVGEYMHKGGNIMFCRRDGNTAHNDMLRMLKDIKQRLPATPKGAIYVSCTARGRNQFGDDSEELKLIRSALGDLPLVGFFANGEIYHNRLYGYTGVLTVFC
jgi:small ligand-binding sensory domain FIST